MRIARLVILLICLSINLLSAMTIREFERQIYLLTNIERQANGLQPLIYEDGLADLARRHSLNMLRKNFFDHKDKEGLQVSGRQEKYYPQLMQTGIGENLAKNIRSTKVYSPREIVQGWMESPGHRENILTPEFTHLGVGVVVKDEVLYATQNFATPVVKLLSPLPLVSKADSLTIAFEYLSTKPRNGFEATIIYPDPKAKYMISKTTYYQGSQPKSLNWKDDKHFTVTVPFVSGKGKYRLSFGWDGYYTDAYFTVTHR